MRFTATSAALLAALAAAPAWAESADHYRGGWRTEGGAPRTYEFVIRGSKVSGVFCTRCADGTTLAPLEGTFDEARGLAFTVRRLDLKGRTVRRESLTARLEQGKLVVSGNVPRHLAIKDPRGPTPGGYQQTMLPPGSPPVPVLQRTPAGGSGPPPAPYVQPAPWRTLTAADVVGVWLGFGVGMEKQYFLIRQDGNRLFGLACGRCDNPYTFGALENFSIAGDILTFDIMHEDWGEGARVPFVRHVRSQIAMNEMRMDARRDDAPDRPGIVASLVGPIALEATRGNAPGE